MKNDKRKSYLDWDETFMQIAYLISQRSKDPNTQNGSCLVNEKNIIIGLGYNGFPRGCSDDDLPWGREGDMCSTKYAYVVHSEENAVLNTSADTDGSRLYSTMFPCGECCKVIIQKGIKEIVYYSDKYHDEPLWITARRMLDCAGVKYRQYIPKYKIKFEDNK